VKPGGSPEIGLKWVVGPVVVAALAAVAGHVRAARARGPFAAEIAALPEAERQAVERAPPLAIANATWALGSVEAVRQMLRFELDRLSDTEGVDRGRTLIRFGIIDTNPDGQAAVFNQACVADPRACDDQLKVAAEREVHARLVSPGNRLPLYFIGGHPRVQLPP
jgi:hypothetical protein